MKKLVMSFLLLAVSVTTIQGQILKDFGKKLEKKIEQKIERKADRQVDKALDKADKKTDEPINKVMDKTPPKSNDKSAHSKEAPLPAKAKKVTNPVFEEVPVNPNLSLTLIGSNCDDFSWFKKGAVLEYEVTNSKGKQEGETRMEILQLKKQNNATVAEVKASITTPHLGDMEYKMSYICDGDKIYMDFGAMLQAMMEKNPELKGKDKAVQEALSNMEINADNGFASFPKKMYVGMKLDDLQFSFKTSTGITAMAFETVVGERQVIAKETITTKAGTFECMKIRSVANTTLKVMGVNQKMPQNIEYLWIAPSIGMVKQETNANTKESSVVQLKSYRL